MGAAASMGDSQNEFQLVFSLSTNRSDTVEQVYSEIYPVWCIDISQNGKQLAAASADQRIHLWCLVTYTILISLTGHGDTVWFVKYSPDNRYLVSGSADGTIRIWQVSTGLPVSILRAHANWVWAVAFTPDGQYFASGGADSRLFLWDIVNPIPLLGMQAHQKSITDLAFSDRDPRKLLTVSSDSLVGVWKVDWGDGSEGSARLKLMAKLEGHLGSINACAVCPSNEHLIGTAGEDGSVRLWSLRELTSSTAKQSLENYHGYNLEHHILHGHKETVWALSFSPNGRLLASGSSDCCIRIWNVSMKNPTLNCYFRAHESWIRSLVWTEDMQMLATGSCDGLVSLWSVPRKHHRPGVAQNRYVYEDSEPLKAWKRFKFFLVKATATISGGAKSRMPVKFNLLSDIPEHAYNSKNAYRAADSPGAGREGENSAPRELEPDYHKNVSPER
eukprot:GEMP01023756.1.p1 GENE.GEMP01023756.1~~GEMP01023756.1.p1  ORF type:complete len:446 (+),score=63.50 GEMP01023756.1:67-1404(+)